MTDLSASNVCVHHAELIEIWIDREWNWGTDQTHITWSKNISTQRGAGMTKWDTEENKTGCLQRGKENETDKQQTDREKK